MRPLDYVKKEKKDTLTYIVEFHDTLERGQFDKELEKLIRSFYFKATADSIKGFYIKTQAVVSEPLFFDSMRFQSGMDSFPQEHEVEAEKAELPPIHIGGTAIVYTPFGALDPALLPLLETFLCKADTCPAMHPDSISDFCDIKGISDKKVSLTLSSAAQNAAGNTFSSFDAVTLWSNHVKQRPAEGRALFRYVKGIDQFIAGREAVVPGFQITDEKTVTLELSQADPFAVQRLRTSRLFPACFKTGPYFIKNEKGNVLQLAPNVHFRLGKPFLNSCEIRLGKDNNPFLSFSLNRYDIMALYAMKDVDYARRVFADKAVLTAFNERRYFLSLAFQSAELRNALCRLFDRKDMLLNYVKAEGRPLSIIETSEDTIDVTPQAPPTLTSIPNTLAAAPIVVLFQNDDPIAAIIADKLLADISHAGLACTVKGIAAEEYEKSLIKRDYGIAVGFVPGGIARDESEKLRMSTIWFNDETNERARIEANQEFPLFSIKTYLLYKNKIGFYNDAIEGVYRKE